MASADFKLSWRNLGRNRRRTALAWAGIAVAQVTLIWMCSFINGYQGLIFEKLTGPMLGHVQIHAEHYRDDNAIERTISKSEALLKDVARQPHVTSISPRVYGPVLATVQELGHVAVVTGLNVGQEIGSGGLLEGLPIAQLPGPNEVLVGKALAGEMMIHIGDTLAVMGQAIDGSVASGLYKVKGLVHSDVEQINRAGIVMDLKVAQDLFAMADRTHEVAVHVDQPENVLSVQAALRKLSACTGLEILTWKELVPQIAIFLQMSDSINFIMLVLIFLTTSAGIANTMLMATFERAHEFGMLLALGCKPGRLIRVLLLESVALGVAGVLIGSVVGAAIVIREMHTGISLPGISGAATVSMEGLDLGSRLFPVLRLSDLIRGVLAVLITSCLATLWPARKISRLEPVEAMRS